MNRILNLNLKSNWFRLIYSGEKTEEYREIKEYWKKRLLTAGGDFRSFDQVRFMNGMRPDSPEVTFEFKGIRIGKPRADWVGPGAKEEYFIISLGEKLSEANINYDDDIDTPPNVIQGIPYKSVLGAMAREVGDYVAIIRKYYVEEQKVKPGNNEGVIPGNHRRNVLVAFLIKKGWKLKGLTDDEKWEVFLPPANSGITSPVLVPLFGEDVPGISEYLDHLINTVGEIYSLKE